ncbi:MAG: hypothetical protein WKF65_11280 [Gaiellaceae bacterium]
MDAVILPEAPEPERRALLAAMAEEKERPPESAWREAALREATGAVDEP